MEKRFIYAFALSLLFILGYNFVVNKYFPKLTPAASTSDITFPSQGNVQPATIIPEPQEELSLSTVTLGKFSVTYSARGGYIKKLIIIEHKEELKFYDIGFVSEQQNIEYRAVIQGDRLVFIANNGSQKEFSFKGYRLDVRLSSTQYPVLLFSNRLSPKPIEQGYQEFLFAKVDDIQRKNFQKIKEESFTGLQFAGSRDQFYCASLLPGSYNVKAYQDKSKKIVQLVLLPSQPEFALYIGPQIAKELAPFELSTIINYGFFHWIGVALVWILSLFYAWTKSWGLSIILLTIFTYVILFPFTMQSTRAMKKMAAMQPELNEIKAKYKDDLQKAQAEQAKLFKKHGVSPVGGCLPYLFQMPVFFALWQVFLRLVQLKGVSFLWIKDLTLPDHLFKLPFTIPFVKVEYFNLIPILMVVLSVLQQKITAPAAPDQKNLMLFMAVFMGVIFYNFPSSMAMYWLVQNILTFLYQLRSRNTQPALVKA